MSRRSLPLLWPALAGVMAGCSPAPIGPIDPAWADVAPIFRGQCNSCHGWTAKDTGASYRFDFFDMTTDVCGRRGPGAGQGIGSGRQPAGDRKDRRRHSIQQSGWARMPPPPSPALPDWDRETLDRWAASPGPGQAPSGNRPPTLLLSALPATADQSVSFTVVLEDPDGDAALGVVEMNDVAFLMNRTGSFHVQFDSSSWPAGAQIPVVTICDGWVKSEYTLAPVQISSPDETVIRGGACPHWQLTGGNATSISHGMGAWLSDTDRCSVCVPEAPHA